jgi:hypothetical protein
MINHQKTYYEKRLSQRTEKQKDTLKTLKKMSKQHLLNPNPLTKANRIAWKKLLICNDQ